MKAKPTKAPKQRSTSDALEQIGEILAIANAPLSVEDIRALVNQRFRAEYDIKETTNRVQYLIKQERLKRWHNPSCVMKYFIPGTPAARAVESPKADLRAELAKVFAAPTVSSPVVEVPATEVQRPVPPPVVSPPLKRTSAPAATLPRPAPSIVRRPQGLLDRCDVIAADIADVLSDACDAQIDHAAIKALLAAQQEMHLAVRKLAA